MSERSYPWGAYSNWNVNVSADNRVSHEDAKITVLQDIRAELVKLNKLLGCENAVAIPGILRAIEKNTQKPKRRKRTVKK